MLRSDRYSGLERSGVDHVRRYSSASRDSWPAFLEERALNPSGGGVLGEGGSSIVEDPEVDSRAVVLPDEYEVESAGVSKNGSLGALDRLVCVVEMIGALCEHGGPEMSEERGCDCDRE